MSNDIYDDGFEQPVLDPLSNLPLGIADFSSLRKNNLVYVDKSALIARLASSCGFYFLSRPRRFGKSLLISTLKSLFKDGIKDFKGLTIENIWHEKHCYPVIHLDFTDCVSFDNAQTFDAYFEKSLKQGISRAGLKLAPADPDAGIVTVLDQFEETLIQNREQQTVLLFDEYDLPLNSCINDKALFQQVHATLNNFWSMIKKNNGCLRFLFFTGVCKYKHLNIFSGTNFVIDLSLDVEYSTLLGYTGDEIRHFFAPYLKHAAVLLNISTEQCLALIKKNYDGFCFDALGKFHVHNPWSVINFFRTPRMGFLNYWYETAGIPSVLLNYLSRHSLRDPEEYGRDVECSFDELNSTQDLSRLSDLALLVQTGYLTIKKKISLDLVILNYPNVEVAKSMARLYSSKFVSSSHEAALSCAVNKFSVEDMVKALNTILLTIPYHSYPLNNEAKVRAILIVCFGALGYEISAECVNVRGRSDIDMLADEKYFVFELKFAKDNDDESELLCRAVEQIKSREYGEQAHPELDHIHVAMVFSAKTRTFTQYTSF